MSIEKILILNEQANAIAALCSKKIELHTCEDADAALRFLKAQMVDLFLYGIGKEGSIELELIQKVKHLYPQLIIIVLTDYQHVEKAIDAMRYGAFNYLIKPFSFETLEAMLQKVQEQARLLQENELLRKEISHASGKREQMIAQSMVMKRILIDVAKVAKSNSSVFISGESGTGKEVIAQAIHMLSPRVGRPFIKVNCAAIPDTLIESEFFGHEKGAFTGAIQRRIGRFEMSDQGTLLLDEISEIPLPLQSKLLRVIQEQEFERIGGNHPIKVDTRLISTSNRLMKEAIEQKLFREDLYYRLNVVPLYLPPLRDRKEDILPLAEYFLERLCIENHKINKRLSNQSRIKLLEYHWPGNIRELANIIERTVVMDSSDLIEPEHLCLDPLACKALRSDPEPRMPLDLSLYELEKRHIAQVLEAQSHNRTKAAEILGIHVRTLRNKIKEYGLV